MAATHSLLGRSKPVRSNSSGRRLPVLFLVIFLLFFIACITLLLPLSDLHHKTPNSDPNTFDVDNHINPISWSSINQTQQARILTYISNQTEVALTIMKQLFLSREAKNKNMLYSPLSIHMVLTSQPRSGRVTRPYSGQMLAFLKANSTQAFNYYIDIS